ncbi:MAG: gluconate 2-dehydrogenase subunit 3 family protein [Saprospiraceae bacterium]
MKRRTALKTIGIGMGATVTFGTFLSTISSCVSEAAAEGDSWQGAFLTDKNQLKLVDDFADIILPATDTPGARDVGVIKYIDATGALIYDAEEQARFKKGLDVCIQTLEKEQGAPYSDLSKEQLTAFLENHIGASVDKETYKAKREIMNQEEPPADEAGQKDFYLYGFLNAVKQLTIAAYFGSKEIGMEHLTYDPIPGPYQGCIDLNGMKSYSL